LLRLPIGVSGAISTVIKRFPVTIQAHSLVKYRKTLNYRDHETLKWPVVIKLPKGLV
jgi:hypothetical protein